MALLCLLFEFFPPGAFLHVVLTFSDGSKNMRDIVLAVDSHRVPRFGHVWISVVEPGLLIFFEFAPIIFKQSKKLNFGYLRIFMLDKRRDIAKVVAGLILALVHCFAFSITTPGDMELPLTILHQLMVLIERANEDSV